MIQLTGHLKKRNYIPRKDQWKPCVETQNCTQGDCTAS